MTDPADLSSTDETLLAQAIALGRSCPETQTAFSVGAVIATPDGTILSTGFSREFGDRWHAEEVAIEKARAQGSDLTGTTLFSSMEPCSIRLSGRVSCTARILAAGICRVVFCLEEPPNFVRCEGAATLRAAGLSVIQDPRLAGMVLAVNRHIATEKRDMGVAPANNDPNTEKQENA